MATVTQLYIRIARANLEKEKGETIKDADLAKELGVRPGTFSKYVTDNPELVRECDDDETIYKLAQIAQVSPFEIMGMIKAKKAKSNEVRDMWEKLSKGMIAGVGAISIAGAMMVNPAPAEASENHHEFNISVKPQYILYEYYYI